MSYRSPTTKNQARVRVAQITASSNLTDWWFKKYGYRYFNPPYRNTRNRITGALFFETQVQFVFWHKPTYGKPDSDYYGELYRSVSSYRQFGGGPQRDANWQEWQRCVNSSNTSKEFGRVISWAEQFGSIQFFPDYSITPSDHWPPDFRTQFWTW